MSFEEIALEYSTTNGPDIKKKSSYQILKNSAELPVNMGVVENDSNIYFIAIDVEEDSGKEESNADSLDPIAEIPRNRSPTKPTNILREYISDEDENIVDETIIYDHFEIMYENEFSEIIPVSSSPIADVLSPFEQSAKDDNLVDLTRNDVPIESLYETITIKDLEQSVEGSEPSLESFGDFNKFKNSASMGTFEQQETLVDNLLNYRMKNPEISKPILISTSDQFDHHNSVQLDNTAVKTPTLRPQEISHSVSGDPLGMHTVISKSDTSDTLSKLANSCSSRTVSRHVSFGNHKSQFDQLCEYASTILGPLIETTVIVSADSSQSLAYFTAEAYCNPTTDSSYSPPIECFTEVHETPLDMHKAELKEQEPFSPEFKLRAAHASILTSSSDVAEYFNISESLIDEWVESENELRAAVSVRTNSEENDAEPIAIVTAENPMQNEHKKQEKDPPIFKSMSPVLAATEGTKSQMKLTETHNSIDATDKYSPEFKLRVLDVSIVTSVAEVADYFALSVEVINGWMEQENELRGVVAEREGSKGVNPSLKVETNLITPSACPESLCNISSNSSSNSSTESSSETSPESDRKHSVIPRDLTRTKQASSIAPTRKSIVKRPVTLNSTIKRLITRINTTNRDSSKQSRAILPVEDTMSKQICKISSNNTLDGVRLRTNRVSDARASISLGPTDKCKMDVNKEVIVNSVPVGYSTIPEPMISQWIDKEGHNRARVEDRPTGKGRIFPNSSQKSFGIPNLDKKRAILQDKNDVGQPEKKTTKPRLQPDTKPDHKSSKQHLIEVIPHPPVETISKTIKAKDNFSDEFKLKAIKAAQEHGFDWASFKFLTPEWLIKEWSTNGTENKSFQNSDESCTLATEQTQQNEIRSKEHSYCTTKVKKPSRPQCTPASKSNSEASQRKVLLETRQVKSSRLIKPVSKIDKPDRVIDNCGPRLSRIRCSGKSHVHSTSVPGAVPLSTQGILKNESDDKEHNYCTTLSNEPFEAGEATTKALPIDTQKPHHKRKIKHSSENASSVVNHNVRNDQQLDARLKSVTEIVSSTAGRKSESGQRNGRSTKVPGRVTSADMFSSSLKDVPTAIADVIGYQEPDTIPLFYKLHATHNALQTSSRNASARFKVNELDLIGWMDNPQIRLSLLLPNLIRNIPRGRFPCADIWLTGCILREEASGRTLKMAEMQQTAEKYATRNHVPVFQSTTRWIAEVLNRNVLLTGSIKRLRLDYVDLEYLGIIFHVELPTRINDLRNEGESLLKKCHSYGKKSVSVIFSTTANGDKLRPYVIVTEEKAETNSVMARYSNELCIKRRAGTFEDVMEDWAKRVWSTRPKRSLTSVLLIDDSVGSSICERAKGCFDSVNTKLITGQVGVLREFQKTARSSVKIPVRTALLAQYEDKLKASKQAGTSGKPSTDDLIEAIRWAWNIMSPSEIQKAFEPCKLRF